MQTMEDLFEHQRKCLRAMGHALPANQHKQKLQQQQQQVGIQWSLIYGCTVLLVASAQWPMTCYCIFHKDDLSLATAGLSIIFTNILAVIKMSTFLFSKRKFVELMNTFTLMYERMCEPHAKAVLQTENRKSTRLIRVYLVSTFCTGAYFMMAPLLKICLAKLMMKPVVLELPMPMRFSFDSESTPGYELAYIYTFFITLVVVMYSSAVDGIFLAFAINLRAHFKALQNFIEKNSFQPNALQRIEGADELQQNLANLVRYHKLLLSLSEEVCRIYKPIIFGQFLMTSLEVCLIVYQLVTHMHEYMSLVVYGSFLCAIMLQLLIYCYGGEIISNESVMVSIAVQLSDWYKLPPRYRRMLLLMMLRSQRAVTIRAFFYVASLENFMMILKAAMSYITLIQSIE